MNVPINVQNVFEKHYLNFIATLTQKHLDALSISFFFHVDLFSPRSRVRRGLSVMSQYFGDFSLEV